MYQDKALICKECRKTRKKGDKLARVMYDVVCESCGRLCKVSFKPTGGRSVYCNECISKMIAFAVIKNSR